MILLHLSCEAWRVRSQERRRMEDLHGSPPRLTHLSTDRTYRSSGHTLFALTHSSSIIIITFIGITTTRCTTMGFRLGTPLGFKLVWTTTRHMSS